MANIFHVERTANKITLGTTGTTINVPPLTASLSLGLDASKNLESVDLSSIYQPLDAVLTDLAALDVVADNEFIVGTGAGVYAHESGATARTSIGLGNVENTQLSTWAGTMNITTLGTIATVGNITIADGGTIGQAAGPLLTFDNTNDYLEITGCKVGINTSDPQYSLDFGTATTGGRDIGWSSGVATQYAAIGTLKSGASLFMGRCVESDSDNNNRLNYATAANLSKGAIILVNDGLYIALKAPSVVGIGDEFAWATTYKRLFLSNSGRLEVPQDIFTGTANDGVILRENGTIGEIIGINNGLSEFNHLHIRVGSNYGLFLKTTGKNGINDSDPKTALTVSGALTLKEQAAADGDTETYGQIWVKTATPNELWFTDDAGTDHKIAFV